MRHIVLSEDGYNLVSNAAHRLLAPCFFPESVRDQEQALFIAALEQAEYRRVGQEHYQPSEIMVAATKLIENRAAQLYAVGFIALCYIYLAGTRYKPSLNRASTIASCSANTFGKVVWRDGLDPNGKEKQRSVTSDPASLERLFRRYRSAAHICAARVSAGGYLDHTHIWDETPLVTETMIQTAATYQDALEQVTEVKNWNLWDLKKYYPARLSGSPFLPPDKDLLHWIGTGYEIALDEGKIVLPDGGGRKTSPG
jgi:hypothetical protein